MYARYMHAKHMLAAYVTGTRALIVATLMTLVVAAPTVAGAKVALPALEPGARGYEQALKDRAARTSPSIVEQLALARAAEAEGRWTEAITHVEALAGAAPQTFEFWLRLTNLLVDRQPRSARVFDAAVATYLKATTREEEVEALLTVGRALRNELERIEQENAKARDRQESLDAVATAAAGERPVDDYGTPVAIFPDSPGRISSSERLTPPDPVEVTAQGQQGRAERESQRRRFIELARVVHDVYNELFRLVQRTVAPKQEPWNALPQLGQLFKVINKEPIWKSDRKAVAACFEFNVELTATAAVYKASWLTVRQVSENAAPATVAFEVAVDKTLLCISGLVHGRSYSFEFKRDLPANAQVKLAAPLRFERWKAPNLPASVLFRNAAYVVPNSGEKTIPVHTMNARRLGLELVRVSDRNVHRQLALRQIGANMKMRELAEMYSTFSEPIWKGEKAIADSIDNQARVTDLPIFKLLEERRTWLRSQAATSDGAGTGTAARQLGRLDGYFASGSFYRDPASYQSPGEKLWEPGVFALVARLADVSDSSEVPVQWFVFTDLGLTYYASASKLYVVARSLATGQPRRNVRIQLVAQNNRVLAERQTDADGITSFDGRLAQGSHGNKLAAIMGHEDAAGSGRNDFSFVDVLRDAVDLSRVGVAGREPPGPLDAFIYTDRGVYRPDPEADHNVHATILLRGADGSIPKFTQSVRVRLRTPSGVVLDDSGLITAADLERQFGGGTVDLKIPTTAPLGSAIVEVFAGASAQPIGSAQIQIAHIRPDRARLQFVPPAGWQREIGADGTARFRGRATVQYLQGRAAIAGAPVESAVRGAMGEIETRIERAQSPIAACFAGFEFGTVDVAFSPMLSRSAVGPSGVDGGIEIDVAVKGMPVTSHPLKARMTLSMLDAAGTLATKSLELPVPRLAPWLGLRRPNITAVGAGQFKIDIEAAALKPDFKARPGTSLNYRLSQERSEFVWYTSGDTWNYRPDIGRTIVAQGTMQTGAETGDLCETGNAWLPGVTVGPGVYLLEVDDGASGRTSIRVTVGATNAEGKRPEPHLIKVFAVKPSDARGEAEFKPGEAAEFRLETPFDGPVSAAIMDGGEVVQWLHGMAANRVAKLTVETVPVAWAGRGHYLVANVYRGNADGTEAQGPARAIGALHFTVDRQRSQLTVALDGTPFQITPGVGLPVRLTAFDPSGAKFNGRAMVALHAVDEGLINLTDHGVPQPYGHFFGRRRLAFEMHDSYSRLLLTREGGDANLLSRLIFNNYLSDKIVSRSALHSVEFKDGVGVVPPTGWTFDGFSGTVRLSAVVWTADRIGADHKDVLVRDVIVADLGLPRFLAPRDRPILPLMLENLEAGDGEFSVRLIARGLERMTLPGQQTPVEVRDNTFRVRLARGERRTALLHFDVGEVNRSADDISIEAVITGTGQQRNLNISRRWNIKLRQPFAPSVVQVASVEIAPQASFRLQVPATIAQSYRWPSIQARFTTSPYPAPAAMPPRELADGVQHLDRLVWSSFLLLHQSVEGARPAALDRVLSNIVTLQHRSGGFLPFKLERTSDGRDKIRLLKDAGSADAFDRDMWRTALAVEALRLGTGTTGRHAKQLRSAVDFLKLEAARQLNASTVVDGIEQAGARATLESASDARERARDADRDQTYFIERAKAKSFDDDGSDNPLPNGRGDQDPDSDKPAKSRCTAALGLSAYVLVRLDEIDLAGLKPFADACRAKTTETPHAALGQLLVAAALKAFGKTDDATALWQAFAAGWVQEKDAQQETDRAAYMAILLTFIDQVAPESPQLQQVLREISALRRAGTPASIESHAWLARAVLERQVRPRLAVNITPPRIEDRELLEATRADELATRFIDEVDVRQLNIAANNTGTAPVTATIFARGVATRPETKAAPFTFQRRFFRFDGREITGATIAVAHNEPLFVVIDGQRQKPQPAETDGEAARERPVLVVDLLPSGFEIINAELTDGSGALPTGLPSQAGDLRHTEARDDRFIAIVTPAFSGGGSGDADGDADSGGGSKPSAFRVIYTVRATTSGQFALPQVRIEDLQRPELTAQSLDERTVSVAAP